MIELQKLLTKEQEKNQKLVKSNQRFRKSNKVLQHERRQSVISDFFTSLPGASQPTVAQEKNKYKISSILHKQNAARTHRRKVETLLGKLESCCQSGQEQVRVCSTLFQRVCSSDKVRTVCTRIYVEKLVLSQFSLCLL